MYLVINDIKQLVKPIREQLERDCIDEGYFEPNERVTSPPFCESISEKVTELLVANGYDAVRVVGTFANSGLHCWTTVGNLVVDVTVDQFGERYPQILVEPIANYSQYKS